MNNIAEQKRIKSAVMSNRAVRTALQFFAGGLLYGGLEVAYRGYTHRSMLVVGGLCFVLLCAVARSNAGLIAGAVAGGLAITAVELAAGVVFNLWLGWGVWNYSNQPFNLFGQVCLGFSLLWCGLSGVIIYTIRYFGKNQAAAKESALSSQNL